MHKDHSGDGTIGIEDHDFGAAFIKQHDMNKVRLYTLNPVVTHGFESAWFQPCCGPMALKAPGFNPRAYQHGLSSDFLVSSLCFQMHRVPLQQGRQDNPQRVFIHVCLEKQCVQKVDAQPRHRALILTRERRPKASGEQGGKAVVDCVMWCVLYKMRLLLERPSYCSG
jgi:hypothetical protein